MTFFVLFVAILIASLLYVGRGKEWGYMPVSLASLLFVVPIGMLMFGFI